MTSSGFGYDHTHRLHSVDHLVCPLPQFSAPDISVGGAVGADWSFKKARTAEKGAEGGDPWVREDQEGEGDGEEDYDEEGEEGENLEDSEELAMEEGMKIGDQGLGVDSGLGGGEVHTVPATQYSALPLDKDSMDNGPGGPTSAARRKAGDW